MADSMKQVVIAATLLGSWGLLSSCERFKSCEDAKTCPPDSEGPGHHTAGAAGTPSAECSADETRTITCGLNGEGVQTQSCSDGAWQEQGKCDDPDECENGAKETVNCGRDDLGEAPRECVDGKWEKGLCRHPDYMLSLGTDSTCALLKTGDVYCWGSNSSGQLGKAGTAGTSTPTQAITSSRSAFISGKISTHYTITESKTLSFWGNEVSTPQAENNLSEVIQVSAGGFHVCALTKIGKVFCWGAGDKGQLGTGFTIDSTFPVEVVDLNDAVQLSSGYEHSCALKGDGKVFCWGRGDSGQIGYGRIDGVASKERTPNKHRPTEVTGMNDATVITAGEAHSCALRKSGKVYCWGAGQLGQLGIGSTVENSPFPVEVTAIENVKFVAAGDNHTCSVHSSGEISCWGARGYGRLGDGNAAGTVSNTPVPVSGLKDAISVNAGPEHSCAIRANWQIFCWGRGSSGQLGYGGTQDQLAPVAVLMEE